MIELLETSDYDVKREANWALANAASGGTPDQVCHIRFISTTLDVYEGSAFALLRYGFQIKYLVECKALPPLCEVLGWTDDKLLGVVLEALDRILKTGEQMKESLKLDVNPYVNLIEEVNH